MKKIKIAPSLLSANFANLEKDIQGCEEAGADLLHVDVMDGHFVPNITIGVPVVKSIKKITSIPIDCHLMISEPERYVEKFAEAGADMISIHAEGQNHINRVLSQIRGCGKLAGLALNPATPICYAYESVEFCDFILLMSVNPGFGGQSFINSFYRRCNQLTQILKELNLPNVEIEVDGGVKSDNIQEIAASGANIFVSGSGIFSGKIKENIIKLRTNSSKPTLKY